MFEKIEFKNKRWFNLTPLLNEEFKDIEGYEGHYQISNYGRVKSLKRKYQVINPITKNNNVREVKETIISGNNKNDKNRYITVDLYKENKYKTFPIHRLVAQAFILNPNNLPFVNHKNGIKVDNRVDNLEWIDCKGNLLHAVRTGLIKTCKKVQQLDLNNNLLNEFISVGEATRITNICHIAEACRSERKTAGGYIWKYKEE